jgi:hypothetical protein
MPVYSWNTLTEHRGRLGKAIVSYLLGAGFKSRLQIGCTDVVLSLYSLVPRGL